MRKNHATPTFITRDGQSYHGSFAPPREWLRWCGRIRKHSNRLMLRTAITVKGMSAIKSPKVPSIAINPKKAMFVVKVAETTGQNIRSAARSAATTGASPNTRRRYSACSPTTMASSTTIPSVMINANNEIMLIVSPPACISATPDSIATGIPAATQIAVRVFKNSTSSSRTSPSPITALSSSRLSRPDIWPAVELNSSIRTPAGKPTRICSATSSTSACKPIASPVADLSTRICTAGSSPTKKARSRFAGSTRTRPTSPTVKLAPSAVWRKTIRAISLAERLASPARTRAVPAISPAGCAVTSRPIAPEISCMLISCRIRASEGTSTTTRPAATPWIVVCVTPRANSRVTISSANCPNCSAPTGPEITRSVTLSENPPRRIVGSSASAGKARALFSTICTSRSARSISCPGANASAIRARPSDEVESDAITPATSISAGSST